MVGTIGNNPFYANGSGIVLADGYRHIDLKMVLAGNGNTNQ